MNEYDKMSMYLEMGVIELQGMDENGEIIYSINESAKELAPELWASHQENIDSMLLDLYKKDLISVEYNENLEASIRLSPEAKQIAKEHGLIEFSEENIPND